MISVLELCYSLHNASPYLHITTKNYYVWFVRVKFLQGSYKAIFNWISRYPYRDTKSTETGSILDKKRRVSKCVLTEDKLDEVTYWGKTRQSGRKIRIHSTEIPLTACTDTEISMSSKWWASKLLKWKPYKRTVVHELLPHDHAKRLNFSNWILQIVHNGIIDPHLIFSFLTKHGSIYMGMCQFRLTGTGSGVFPMSAMHAVHALLKQCIYSKYI